MLVPIDCRTSGRGTVLLAGDSNHDASGKIGATNHCITASNNRANGHLTVSLSSPSFPESYHPRPENRKNPNNFRYTTDELIKFPQLQQQTPPVTIFHAHTHTQPYKTSHTRYMVVSQTQTHRQWTAAGRIWWQGTATGRIWYHTVSTGRTHAHTQRHRLR